MEQRNFEPLMILAVTGIFLLFLEGAVMRISQNKQQTTLKTESNLATIIDKENPVPAAADSAKAIFTDNETVPSTYTGMEVFYQSVQQVQSDHTMLHIAYFGDSMIEGDLITQSLRRSMQRKFGGNGIGFIPITSPLPGFRTTVKQSFNDNWGVYSFVHPGNSQGAYPGISGYVYISEEGAETRFESPAGYGPFHKAEIVYGGKNTIAMKVITDTSTVLLSLTPVQPVSSYTVTRDSAFSVFKINVTSTEPGVFYGVNFENGPGVYVDNYAFRGNSGLPLNAIPTEIFTGFNSTLRNKLLILHYGLNVFTPGVDDYHWYEKAMENVIRHVKQSSPGVSILVISMPDRSALISGEYHTPAALPGFIRLQQRVAAKEQVAFFNLYDAMGGANSMKKWVEGQPKLAGDDYTHPNGAGAAKIASLVYDYLMKGYGRYIQINDSLSHDKIPEAGL